MPSQPHHHLNPTRLAFARELRKSDIPAEQILWRRLRSRQLNGLKFRRNAPVGAYIADFLCAATRTVIELDGPSHDQRQFEDAARSAALEEIGYRVIRFTNEDVYENLEGVLVAIVKECFITPRK